MRRAAFHKIGLLFPALTWLFIQFAMSGVMLGSSANAMQITICSPLGIQTISVDPETGQPVEQAIGGESCDWCQSFGLITDDIARGPVPWAAVARSYQHDLVLSPPPHKPLRLGADFHSRAPPIL